MRQTFAKELRRLCRRTRRAVSHKNIHALRKGIAQLRSWLRLVREEIGDRRFRRHNRRLRQAARQLAPARDARVRAEALATLGKSKSFPQTAARLRRQIGRARHALPTALRRVEKLLREELAKCDRLPLKAITCPQLVLAWERMHRETEAAGITAGVERDPPTLHTWRKRLKNELHALAFVTGLKTPPSRLTCLLGEDHDLVLLAETLKTRAQDAEARRLRRRITARRARLQKQIFPKHPRRRPR